MGRDYLLHRDHTSAVAYPCIVGVFGEDPRGATAVASAVVAISVILFAITGNYSGGTLTQETAVGRPFLVPTGSRNLVN